METNCSLCGDIIEDDLVEMCEACLMDGLCPDCYNDHECEEME